MNDRSPLRAIFFLLLILAGAAAVGFWAYQAGVQHGMADAGRLAAIPPEGATHIYVTPWPGPWHGGYFPIFPLIFGFFLVLFLVRGFAWRGRVGCGPRWRDGVPPGFDEWHRRAHERMAGAPPPERNA